MRRSLYSFCAFMCAAVLAAATLQRDVAANTDAALDDSPLPTTEPILGSAAVTAPGDETPQKDPFEPFDVGGPEAHWTYEDLNADEQAVIDRGRADAGRWQSIHNAYASAVNAQSKKARAAAAAHQLGVEGLEIGVVP